MTTINFYKSSSTLDDIICFLSRDQYCHVTLTVNGMSYGAAPFGTVQKSRTTLLSSVRDFNLKISQEQTEGNVDNFHINLTREQEVELVAFLDAQLGKKYDYLSVIGFVLYTEDRSKSNRWFCSELVFAALRKVGVELLTRVPAWKVSPAMLSYSPII